MSLPLRSTNYVTKDAINPHCSTLQILEAQDYIAIRMPWLLQCTLQCPGCSEIFVSLKHVIVTLLLWKGPPSTTKSQCSNNIIRHSSCQKIYLVNWKLQHSVSHNFMRKICWNSGVWKVLRYLLFYSYFFWLASWLTVMWLPSLQLGCMSTPSITDTHIVLKHTQYNLRPVTICCSGKARPQT